MEECAALPPSAVRDARDALAAACRAAAEAARAPADALAFAPRGDDVASFSAAERARVAWPVGGGGTVRAPLLLSAKAAAPAVVPVRFVPEVANLLACEAAAAGVARANAANAGGVDVVALRGDLPVVLALGGGGTGSGSGSSGDSRPTATLFFNTRLEGDTFAALAAMLVAPPRWVSLACLGVADGGSTAAGGAAADEEVGGMPPAVATMPLPTQAHAVLLSTAVANARLPSMGGRGASADNAPYLHVPTAALTPVSVAAFFEGAAAAAAGLHAKAVHGGAAAAAGWREAMLMRAVDRLPALRDALLARTSTAWEYAWRPVALAEGTHAVWDARRTLVSFSSARATGGVTLVALQVVDGLPAPAAARAVGERLAALDARSVAPFRADTHLAVGRPLDGALPAAGAGMLTAAARDLLAGTLAAARAPAVSAAVSAITGGAAAASPPAAPPAVDGGGGGGAEALSGRGGEGRDDQPKPRSPPGDTAGATAAPKGKGKAKVARGGAQEEGGGAAETDVPPAAKRARAAGGGAGLDEEDAAEDQDKDDKGGVAEAVATAQAGGEGAWYAASVDDGEDWDWGAWSGRGRGAGEDCGGEEEAGEEDGSGGEEGAGEEDGDDDYEEDCGEDEDEDTDKDGGDTAAAAAKGRAPHSGRTAPRLKMRAVRSSFSEFLMRALANNPV